MADPKIVRRTTVIRVVAVAILAVGIAVIYFDRPSRRVSLPAGTRFPACLLTDAPSCQESSKCVADAPGGLTYGKFHGKIAADGRDWCCPDGTTADATHIPVTC